MGPELLKCERAVWYPTESMQQKKRVTHLGDVVDMVCRERGVSKDVVLGRARWKREVAARHEVWARLDRLGWSASAIARSFGRDHTTVLAALAKPRKAIPHDQ